MQLCPLLLAVPSLSMPLAGPLYLLPALLMPLLPMLLAEPLQLLLLLPSPLLSVPLQAVARLLAGVGSEAGMLLACVQVE